MAPKLKSPATIALLASLPDHPIRRICPPPTPQDVVAGCARAFGCLTSDLVGPGKQQHHMRARWAAVRALRELGLSYPAIASHLGDRHHSTVMYAVARYAAKCESGEFDAARDDTKVCAQLRDTSNFQFHLERVLNAVRASPRMPEAVKASAEWLRKQ